MDSLKIKLKNCFGINELEKEFTFKKIHSVLIYAPNGTMKTSLTETFKYYKAGNAPIDRLHNKPASWEIIADTKPLDRDEVLIIEPFTNDFEQKEFSSLLVDLESKKTYDEIISSIEKQTSKIVNNLNKSSGVPKLLLESTITADFEVRTLLDVLELIVDSDQDISISGVRYLDIFNKDVEKLMANESFKKVFSQYQSRYLELLKNKPVFNNGSFTPANANSITTSLEKNNYFSAGHSIRLNGIEPELKNGAALQEVLQDQQKELLNDPVLTTLHNELLNGVASVTKFQTLLVENPSITHRLADPKKLKRDLWEAYLLNDKSALESLLNEFKENKKKLEEIENRAASQIDEWEETLKEFNSRFDVPYIVEVENLKSAVLGKATPNLVFKFVSEDGDRILSRKDLEQSKFLSRGETRAFYLMNVLFEIKARTKESKPTLIIADDIADSFDYRNKAAILEYLGDISQNELFKLIILTHNFDFYRSYRERIMWSNGQKANCFIAHKTNVNVVLTCTDRQGIHKPFEHWKSAIAKADLYATLAMISCVRNLIEYGTGKANEHYKLLTSLLHHKDDSISIDFESLENVYKDVIGLELTGIKDKKTPVQSSILELSDLIAEEENLSPLDLAKKVVLSIGIRLKFEQFCKKILPGPFEFTSNQTSELYRMLKNAFQDGLHGVMKEHIEIARKVTLITPENIHLNSFMYEPLMDLPFDSLTSLYKLASRLEKYSKLPKAA